MAPLIVKADLKHLTYVYTGGESDFLCSLKIYGDEIESIGVVNRWMHV